MLNGPDLEKLLRLFENEDNTMEKILGHFKKDFSYDRFKVCYALSLFTEENVGPLRDILFMLEDAHAEAKVLRALYYSIVISGGAQEQQASIHRCSTRPNRKQEAGGLRAQVLLRDVCSARNRGAQHPIRNRVYPCSLTAIESLPQNPEESHQ